MAEGRITFVDQLAQERRGRLAAERMLEHKQRELSAAHQRLSLHARSLSEQVVAQRRFTASALSEAEEARGLASRAQSDLQRAHLAAVLAERRLWDSVETIEDGFAVFDSRLTLIAANRAWLAAFDGLEEIRPGVGYARILELAAGEGVVGTDGMTVAEWVGDMTARLDLDPIPPRVLRLWDGGWIRMVDRRAQGGDLVCLALNITEAMLRETRLKEAQERAEAATRAKSAFLANMSHELRTPMNGVVGMAELLCDTALTEDQRLYAETIRSSGEALLAILNDILDFSKIEAEKLILHPEPFDLERCIHDVAMLLQPTARARGIALVVDFDLFLPTCFVGDPVRIRQVLTNLVGNAVKFTEKGHVLIRVVGVEEEGEDCRIHVTVEDTGIGIAADQLDRIFGEFSQVEERTSRRFGGTGLGLAITRQLIDLMEGEVWVESEPGRGSCFGFRLRLPVAEAAPCPPRQAVPKRALVVDGGLLHRSLLERQLAAVGMAVTPCRTAEEALEAVRRAPVDLILTDHDLAGIPGPALAAQLREEGFSMPVVLMSDSPPKAREHPGAEHLAAILQKPVLRADLYRRLEMLHPPVPPAPVGMTPAEGVPPSAPAKHRPMRVLVAEDNRTNQLVFSRMVKALPIELLFADNGVEAVEKWESFGPDLIFMDISMPELDGRAATRRIRQREAETGRPRVPVAALTANAMEEDERRSLAAGLDLFLTKPLKKSVILDCIDRFRPAVAEGGG